MKPLIVLLITFLIALFAIRIFQNAFEFALAARIALSAMLLFTATAHFVFAKGMTMMMPEFIPFKKELVFLTGIIEIMAAIGLQIPNLRVITAWLLILFFILILPSNIKASRRRINYQKETYDGNGLSYLWFRIPLQILFICWTYWSAIGF